MTQREQFEKWVHETGAKPDTARHQTGHQWAGQYKHVAIEAPWRAWQAAAQQRDDLLREARMAILESACFVPSQLIGLHHRITTTLAKLDAAIGDKGMKHRYRNKISRVIADANKKQEPVDQGELIHVANAADAALADQRAEVEGLRSLLKCARPFVKMSDGPSTDSIINSDIFVAQLCKKIDQALTPKDTPDE